MSKVFFEQLNFNGGTDYIALRVGKRKAHVFHFRREDNFETAREICTELVTNEYTAFNVGTIGDTPVLLLSPDDDTTDALIFEFDNLNDAQTACEMTEHFFALAADDDDDETVAK